MDAISRDAEVQAIRARAEERKHWSIFSNAQAEQAFRDRETLLEALDAERAKSILLGDTTPRAGFDILSAMRRIEDDIRATIRAADKRSYEDTTIFKNTGKRYTLTVEETE